MVRELGRLYGHRTFPGPQCSAAAESCRSEKSKGTQTFEKVCVPFDFRLQPDFSGYAPPQPSPESWGLGLEAGAIILGGTLAAVGALASFSGVLTAPGLVLAGVGISLVTMAASHYAAGESYSQIGAGVANDSPIGSFYKAATGRDMLTGQSVSGWQQGAAFGAGLLDTALMFLPGFAAAKGARAATLSCRIASAEIGAAFGAGIGALDGGLHGCVNTGTIAGTLSGVGQGAFGGALIGGVAGFANPFVCFVAGTDVVMRAIDEDGQTVQEAAYRKQFGGVTTLRRMRYLTKSIETVSVDELVLARDQFNPTGPLVLCRVTRVYKRVAYHLQIVTIRDSAGVVQTLQTTGEHRFGVEGREFVDAQDLVSGDILIEPAFAGSTVLSSVRKEHPEGVWVYNMEVEGAHTYFVRAEGSAAEPVWVHNADYTLATGEVPLGSDFVARRHNLIATQIRDGEVIATRQFVSGDITREEWALGREMGLSDDIRFRIADTEPRAIRALDLQPGDTVIFEGQSPPCADFCQGFMMQTAQGRGVRIFYNARDAARNLLTWSSDQGGFVSAHYSR